MVIYHGKFDFKIQCKLQLLLLICLFGFINKGLGKAKVSIEFITPGPAQLVEVDMPIGDDFSFDNPTYYNVENGRFSFEVKVSRATLVQIKTSFKRIFVVVGPDDDIKIKIQKTFDKYKVLSFEGPNAEGQYWYNIYNDQPLANRISHEGLFAALSAKSKNAGLEKLGKFIGRQTRPLTALYKQGKINNQFYRLIKPIYGPCTPCISSRILKTFRKRSRTGAISKITRLL
jgi:hypothetical protein